MINLDNVVKRHNPSLPHIPDHPYRILIIGGSRSGKKTPLFNLIIQQPGIDKIYLYAKDQYKVKHEFLFN